jgi:hypothetical protein
MLYQYGYFKPLVARKAGRILTVRQLVPSLFVLAVAVSLVLGLWWAPAVWTFTLVLGLYSLLIGAVALRAARSLGVRGALALAAVFPTMHVNYGIGYLRGIWDHFLRFRSGRAAAQVALSR